MAATKPEDCDVLLFRYLGENDLESALSLFENDAVFIHPDGVAHGRDAIRDQISGMLTADSLDWLEGPEAFVDASGTLAFVRGKWSTTFTNSDGSQTISTGRNIEVVRKQADGTWKFVIDHGNAAD
ncbi:MULTISPECIES: YybH family protein [Nocardiaceae]|uniref:DUF4440 domain-containing protein n=1 Tax=Rhodococcoides kroppenstedtii TaxID=293050 RepID=A0ABS7NNN7_9NOCA|nr:MULTISPECIES: DUF4440 domain-containing protein [Rhodococcus]AMY19578.1 hypothetical protein A3Q40_02204 [Rhodococcus sp. PBTS 1]MBY6312305.1 DUF4440 domain-containing protein [Rhodococcus kroppenstedtii]MBY6319611.1 DUF4440 domain-containing protein [Rhodococcus kroppenstedtii]MBY6398294.1 DUF4440 domain-containing protein [Rhodococcus kroppenstedtii]MBY6436123.1 DUF4440 domain-containing protein [Rhodococcus kroppenstedtii]